jgi:serine/threonine-protein kinase
MDTDRNLLFGVLALQMDFISRDALVSAMQAWVFAKNRPLGDILREQGRLTPERLQLLEALVAEHLRAHGGDPQQSLAAVSSLSSVKNDLESLGDGDLQGFVALIGQGRPDSQDATLAHRPPFPGLRYRILRPHAKGGLGEVYVAEDTELHREVALKEIQPEHADDPTRRGRFLLEAEITGGLEHPGVVPVYGLGQYADGRPFYAMRFIRGDNLKDAIDRFHSAERAGRDPGERTLALRQLLGRFVDVCQAVAYAHSRGVLHRDLKPGNIMLGKYGETLVVDWGLAKPVGRPEGKPSADEATLRPSSGSGEAATEAGSAVGTPAYMSPEQAAGRLDQLGPATDIYGLGATLYALLTGKAPFSGRHVEEVLVHVQLGKLVPPRRIKPEVPAALEAICLKAMALRPEDRYASGLELAADLEHWLAEEPVTAYREPAAVRLGRWARRHRAMVTGAAALLVTAVIALAAGMVVVNDERRRTEDERDQKEQALKAESRRRQQARDALDAMSSQVIEDWLAKQKELSPEHKAFLQKALASYEEFARDTGEAEKSRAGVAAAFLRVGEIRRKLGQGKAAEAAYRRCLALYQQLAADFPHRPYYRQDLASTQSNLGKLLSDTGRPKKAESAFRAAIGLRKQLVADFPKQADFRYGLAASYNSLAIVLWQLGRPKGAEAAYRAALRLDTQLAAEFPRRLDLRLAAAQGQNNLGMLLKNTGRLKEAEAAYRAALALKKQAAADFGHGPDFRLAYAQSQNNLGVLLLETGRLEEAEAAYRAALALKKQLANEFPNRPDFRLEAAQGENNLGNLLFHSKRPKEAEAAYRAALAVFKQLAAEFPTRPDYRRAAAISHMTLGILLCNTGRLNEAEAPYRAALVLQERLARDFPAVPDYQKDLANTLDGFGVLAITQRRYADGYARLAQALPPIQKALRANPRHPVYRAVFRDIRLALAEARLGMGQHAAATAAAEEMLRIGYDPVNDPYSAACIVVRCIALAQKDAKLADDKRRDRVRGYTERAMALLRQAVAKGYRDAAHLKRDKDLDPIRSRPDFQKLLAELEK